MANYADFFVKNVSKKNEFRVSTKQPDGELGEVFLIAKENEEKFNLASTNVELIVDVPKGVDAKTCTFKVKSGVDLIVLYSRTESNWTLKIAPNTLLPDAPTTVNIEVGDEPPDYIPPEEDDPVNT